MGKNFGTQGQILISHNSLIRLIQYFAPCQQTQQPQTTERN